jgi:hypothetical protein
MRIESGIVVGKARPTVTDIGGDEDMGQRGAAPSAPSLLKVSLSSCLIR